jgi:hypothetical protein
VTILRPFSPENWYSFLGLKGFKEESDVWCGWRRGKRTPESEGTYVKSWTTAENFTGRETRLGFD